MKETTMISDLDSTTSKAVSLSLHPTTRDLRDAVDAKLPGNKPGYSQVTVPTGSFEIEPNGTILHFRPYDANGTANDELEGLNLFDDVIKAASERDADYFSDCVERGEVYQTSRHLLHGRDLSLILLYHSNTHTYWGFLGPA